MEYNKDQIPFPDILIKINGNGIWMDFYHKPTNTQTCLSFRSSHPNHCKRNIPFFSTKNLRYCRKQRREIKGFGKLKMKFIKIQLPGFANKIRISENLYAKTELLKPKKTVKGKHLAIYYNI